MSGCDLVLPLAQLDSLNVRGYFPSSVHFFVRTYNHVIRFEWCRPPATLSSASLAGPSSRTWSLITFSVYHTIYPSFPHPLHQTHLLMLLVIDTCSRSSCSPSYVII